MLQIDNSVRNETKDKQTKVYLFPDNWFYDGLYLKNIIYIEATSEQIIRIFVESEEYRKSLDFQSQLKVSWLYHINTDTQMVISGSDLEFEKIKEIIEKITNQSLKVLNKYKKMTNDELLIAAFIDQILAR